MSQSRNYRASLPTARKSDGNPEGKGLNNFLSDWQQSNPRGVVAKPRRQILVEFFTSMLVLSASLRFRPAVGGANFLYWIDNGWSLSLIGPDEWSKKRRDGFAGTCVLQRDMTWTIEPSDQLIGDGPVADAFRRYYEGFARMLDTNLSLEELLPFYAEGVHYYQRLYASALSRSVRGSVRLGQQGETSGKECSAFLPLLEDLLSK